VYAYIYICIYTHIYICKLCLCICLSFRSIFLIANDNLSLRPFTLQWVFRVTWYHSVNALRLQLAVTFPVVCFRGTIPDVWKVTWLLIYMLLCLLDHGLWEGEDYLELPQFPSQPSALGLNCWALCESMLWKWSTVMD
jgi:hypothetical protein